MAYNNQGQQQQRNNYQGQGQNDDYKKKQREKALEDYIGVNERIEKFWAKHPNGRIHTEILKWENGVVTMRASIYKEMGDETPYTVGHAYEKEGDGFINKGNALENCETSAIGRALGIGGYEIKKSIASKEEVEQAKFRQANEQQQPPQQQPPQQNEQEPNSFNIIKQTWQNNAGNLQGFNSWYSKRQQAGMGDEEILTDLQNQLAKKQQQA